MNSEMPTNLAPGDGVGANAPDPENPGDQDGTAPLELEISIDQNGAEPLQSETSEDQGGTETTDPHSPEDQCRTETPNPQISEDQDRTEYKATASVEEQVTIEIEKPTTPREEEKNCVEAIPRAQQKVEGKESPTEEKWRMRLIGNSGILMPMIAIVVGVFFVGRIESMKQREILRSELNKLKIQELVKTISMIEDYSFNNQELEEKKAWNDLFLNPQLDQQQSLKELERDSEFSRVQKQTMKLRMMINDAGLSADISDYLHKQAIYSAVNAAYVRQTVVTMEERSKVLEPHSKKLGESRLRMWAHINAFVD